MPDIGEGRRVAAAETLARRGGRCDGEDPKGGTGDAATRRRLLAAGRRVFALKGAGVTVREICAEAGANVAAVSYHFGSKDGLLAEVLSTLLDELMGAFPMDGGVPADAPAGERLHGFVFAFLCRVLLPVGCAGECLLARMLSDAFVRPMPPFEPHAMRHRAAVRDYMLPLLRELAPVGAVAGEGGDEGRLLMIMRSILAQILFYNTNREALMALRDGASFTPREVAELARHITSFSLGGIRHFSERTTC
jgi:AcrR family transcriptional regulator